MALFNSTMQSGPQAQQLGFAPQAVQAPSFAPPTVPTGYGQMQGQPLLSRNPNYGVASGIAALLGGQNPMGAPQASALLNPQQAAPNPMEAINPATGQPFQVFDQATRDQIATDQAAQQEMYVAAQERQGAEQLASQTAEQAERDRVAAEVAAEAQAEQDRIAYEQAVAAAEAQAERDRVTTEAQAESDRIAADAAETARQKIEQNAELRERGFDAPVGYSEVDYSNNPYSNPEREYFDPNIGGEGGSYGGFIGNGRQGGQGGIASMMQNAPVNTPPLNANLVAGTEPTREEQRDIMNSFFGGNAIYPGDPGYEAALAEAGPSSGGLFSGGANLTPEQAERIKAAQAANPGGGFFGKGTNAPNGGSGANTSNSKFNEALLNGVGNIPSKPNTTKMTNNRTPKKLTTQDIQRAMSNMNLGGMF